MSRLTRDGTAEPRLARPNSQARTNADRDILIFPVQLTRWRTGNLTRLIHTLAVCVTIQPYMSVVLNTVRESATPDSKESKQADADSRLFSKAFSVRRVVVDLFIGRA